MEAILMDLEAILMKFSATRSTYVGGGRINLVQIGFCENLSKIGWRFGTNRISISYSCHWNDRL